MLWMEEELMLHLVWDMKTHKLDANIPTKLQWMHSQLLCVHVLISFMCESSITWVKVHTWFTCSTCTKENEHVHFMLKVKCILLYMHSTYSSYILKWIYMIETTRISYKDNNVVCLMDIPPTVHVLKQCLRETRDCLWNAIAWIYKRIGWEERREWRRENVYMNRMDKMWNLPIAYSQTRSSSCCDNMNSIRTPLKVGWITGLHRVWERERT